MDRYMENWATWDRAGGAAAGKVLMRLDLGWYRSTAITCALLYVNIYAMWRYAVEYGDE